VGACGWQPRSKPQGIEVREGNLGLLDRSKRAAPAFTQAERDAFHQELAWIAQDRGYKPGWASFKYKEKFGEWPRSKFAVPRTPSPATRSWVRSRQIAYAKGIAKAQQGAAR
jgi:DNA repair protein RadD